MSGSAMAPKALTTRQRRASMPSNRSVIAARARLAVAAAASAREGRADSMSASARKRKTNGTRAKVMALTTSRAFLRSMFLLELPRLTPLYRTRAIVSRVGGAIAHESNVSNRPAKNQRNR